VIAPVPLAPCAAALTVAVQLVSHVLLAAVQLFGARVVTLQLSVTPPTFTVALNTVENDALEVRRTASVWPLAIVPLVTHAPPLIEICGLPDPLTDTGVLVLIPLIVIAAAVVRVLRFAPVTSANVNAFGVLSHVTTVTPAPGAVRNALHSAALFVGTNTARPDA
jgi:hypothetical protein